MFKKMLNLTLFIAVSFLIVGCGSSSNDEKKLDLTQWSGKWRSVNTAVKHKGLESFFEDLSRENPTYSANGIQVAFVNNIVGSKFTTIDIEKDSITFPIFDRKTKKFEHKKVAYEFVSKQNDSGKTMYQFISKSKDNSLKSVKYISLMKPHGKNAEGFNHWHLLYGSKGFDKLVFSLKGYKPIFVEDSVSDEQLVKFFKKRYPKIKKMFDNSLKDWNGEWVSLASMIDENTEQVNKVISDLIVKYKGKKKGGGDFSKDEVKQAMHNFLTKDFDAYELKIEQNNINFIKNSNLQTFSYILDGTISAGGHGSWIAFKSPENAKNFKHILLSVVHGNPLEFHAKSGDGDYKSIRDKKGVPTFFKKPIDQEELVKELMIFGNISLRNIAEK